MNIVMFKIVVIEKRRTKKFGITMSQLNTFFHHIMNVTSNKQTTLFFLLLSLLLLTVVTALMHAFDVHDRSSVVVVG